LRFSEVQFVAQENRSIYSPKIVEVGRFRFHKRAFDCGNDLLLHAHESAAEVIVLDEWGKLELRGRGFAAGAAVVVEKTLTAELKADLVVVVRDYLLEDFYAWCESIIPKEAAACWPKILDLPRR
jgi:nucleoside-triphosphatase THEP1